MTNKPTDAELVVRLRDRTVANLMAGTFGPDKLCNEAADRIEQLSAQVAALQAKEGGDGNSRPMGSTQNGQMGSPDIATPTRPDAGPGGVRIRTLLEDALEYLTTLSEWFGQRAEGRPTTNSESVMYEQVDYRATRIEGALGLALEPVAFSDAGPGGVPDGWRMVPVEPTEAMKEAGETGWCKMSHRRLPERAGDCYRAMLAAAPSPSAPETK